MRQIHFVAAKRKAAAAAPSVVDRGLLLAVACSPVNSKVDQAKFKIKVTSGRQGSLVEFQMRYLRIAVQSNLASPKV